MTKIEIMDNIVKEHNGYFLLSEATRKGVSKTYALDYVKKNHFEKAARGIYISDDAWVDYLYVIHLKNKGVVFSHESALDMHGLSEREANGIMVTVNRNYNASHLRKMGCTVYSVDPEIHDMGIMEGKTFWGNKVLLYDMDRTICDIIKHRSKIPFQVFHNSIKEYARNPDKNISNLMGYAQRLNIENKVRSYMEMML